MRLQFVFSDTRQHTHCSQTSCGQDVVERGFEIQHIIGKRQLLARVGTFQDAQRIAQFQAEPWLALVRREWLNGSELRRSTRRRRTHVIVQSHHRRFIIIPCKLRRVVPVGVVTIDLAPQEHVHHGGLRQCIEVTSKNYVRKLTSSSMTFPQLMNQLHETRALEQTDVPSSRVEEQMRVRQDHELASGDVPHRAELEDGRHVREDTVDELWPLGSDLTQHALESGVRPDDLPESKVPLLEDFKRFLANQESTTFGDVTRLQRQAHLIAVLEERCKELHTRGVAALLQKHHVGIQTPQFPTNLGLSVGQVQSVWWAVGVDVARRRRPRVGGGKDVVTHHSNRS
mmetsp:Transcript_35017/g.93407  ORF Transcript_35017/g.93407 Transcript_35017/m.93407 type:complete len:342 (+) Transcript_35017:207-1232(+)